jgi:dihydropteroate synthase
VIEMRVRSAEPGRLWRAGQREISLDQPIVVGILNVTPDSFSDGGNFFSPDAAIRHGAGMIADGADIIDIGGESTRPGAAGVRVKEEVRRVQPVVKALRAILPDVPISIDTTKSTVAAEALDAGADIVNDVAGMSLDAAMPSLAATSGCGVIVMHSRGGVEEMATYRRADYGADPMSEIIDELRERTKAVEAAGVERDRIIVDPGFGFSKKSEHSLRVLRELRRLTELGYPVMAGPSRKRFVSEIAGGPDATIGDRDIATVAACVIALERGAMLFRVHNVRAARRALDVAWSVIQNGTA